MYRDPGLPSELSENGGPCTSTISFRAPPHLQQVGRELGIPAGPPLPGQGAGHPRKTASTQSGSCASQEDRLYPGRELGIPGGPPLPGQGAGHPRRTASTQSGSWASQEDSLYPVRELGIPGRPPLPRQGSGHPRRTASTRAGSWASQEDSLYPVRELGIPGGLHLPGRQGQWLGGRCWDALTQGQARVCLQTLGLPANLSLGISLVRACQVLLNFQSD